MTDVGTARDLGQDQPHPGVHRTVLSGAQASLTEYRFDPGACFPIHSHPQEQLTMVSEGPGQAPVDGRLSTLARGDWFIVDGEVAHGIVAGAAGARIYAVVAPARRDDGEIELSGR